MYFLCPPSNLPCSWLLPSFIDGILAQSCSSIGRLRHFFCRLDGSQQTTPERNLRPIWVVWYIYIYIYRYKYSYTSTCLSFHIVSIYLLYFQKKYVSLRDKWELITSFPLTCSYLHHADNRLSLSKFKASKAIVTKAGSFGGIISLANNTRCHQGNMNGEAIGMQVWH